MSILEIRITDTNAHILLGGDLNKIARAIAKIGLQNDDFAIFITRAVDEMNEELEANRVSSEMIGMILNPK